ncbi:hypothetical protein CR513_07926, partial [Mucuna pruriens]
MCKADSTAYIVFVERGRIFKFLHGLNSEYGSIRVQILGKEKLPYLSKIFFIVRSEETQQSIMLDIRSSNIGFAIVIEEGFTKGSIGSTKGSTSEGKPFTKSIVENIARHIKDTYYKLCGKEKVLERTGENKGQLKYG